VATVTPDMFPEVVPAEDPNRRYTTAAFMAWIKAKSRVDSWDLDVAADAESHWAPRWFSLQPYPGSAGINGLAQWWVPHEPVNQWRDESTREPRWRIYCNPPFDDLEAWLVKTWETCALAQSLAQEVVIAFVLPGNRHEQPFWHEHVEPYRDGRVNRYGYRLDLHFPEGRQAYAKPGSNGVAIGSADFPSALLLWRRA
jgi:hypothetical protein